jgi:glycosyltransferase involved in cell wall biosynthesis
MIFHCLGIPYSMTRKDFSLCAFTQKVYKFCKEMTKRGHTVIHYGGEYSQVICSEDVTCIDLETVERVYGGRDWKKQGFDQQVNNEVHKKFNQNAITEIKKRKKGKGEFLMCWFGYGHSETAEVFKDEMFIVEPSIGYDSSFAPIKIFETYCQMHKLFGKEYQSLDPAKSGVVYPGFYQEDFEFKNKKEDWGLFLGRITTEKGAKIAYDLANYSKKQIKFAGPNIINLPETDYCKFIGFVDPAERKILLSNAAFVIAPTLYVEPCNWVAIEAQFSGTPVITTDWGGFTETNIHGITGYRCRTSRDFISALSKIKSIKPENCLINAVSKFLIQTQCQNYEDFFEQVSSRNQ